MGLVKLVVSVIFSIVIAVISIDVIITLSGVFVLLLFIYGLVAVSVVSSAACDAQTLWTVCVVRIVLLFGQMVPSPDLKK